MDPQIFRPIWLLCRNIKSSVTTEFLVFVAGFYCSMQFFVTTNFDNVTSEFCCSNLVLVAIGMCCVMTQNLIATNFSFFFCFWKLSRHQFLCRDKHFSSSACLLCHDRISLVPQQLCREKYFFVATDFSSLVLRAGNDPSYSGSARELNEPSLSLNLGLINLGLDSKKARLGLSGPIRCWNEASAYGLRPAGYGLHRCDPDSGVRE